MKLHPLQRKARGNRFCGPAALSVILGIDTDEAARRIRANTGKRSVTGTGIAAMRSVLRDVKYRLVTVFDEPEKTARPSLAGWIRDSVQERRQGRLYLISAGMHWQLISGRRYICGRVGEICSISDKRVKRRARVSAVYEVTDWR